MSGEQQATDQLPEWKPPSLEVDVQPREVKVGDTLEYRIRVVHPEDVAVRLPASPPLAPYELIGLDHEQEPVEGGVRETWTLHLGVYHVEEADVPQLVLPVVTPEGPARLVLPPQHVILQGQVSDPKSAKPRELAPPETVWIEDYTPLYIGGAVLAALLLLLAGWIGIRRWRARPRKAPPPPPPLPLDVRTRKAIEALQARRLLEAGRHREYYFELSEILRRYLGERFHFDALECTTTELLERLRDRPTPGLDYAKLESFLYLADRVKFARYRPTAAESSEALDTVYAIVDATTRAVRAAEAARAEEALPAEEAA
ncbi:MAG: DUF4381 family protein [Deltaproteobacteria bacterium]|nr:MAG: DUF4381 family protein [Deltaproteobacteria bacterium]